MRPRKVLIMGGGIAGLCTGESVPAEEGSPDRDPGEYWPRCVSAKSPAHDREKQRIAQAVVGVCEARFAAARCVLTARTVSQRVGDDA